MTTTEMKTQYRQSSDWSMPQSGSSYLRDSMIVMSQNEDNFTNYKQDYNINQDKPNNQREKRWRLPNFLIECCSSKAPFLYGLLLGALTSGLILAIVLTLLLTSANKKTSTTTTMNVLSINNNTFVINTTTSTIISTNPSTTSSTRTTSSTTTFTTTAITTTVNPCGAPLSIGSSSSIYSTSSGSNSYTCRYVAWTASTTGSVTLVFQFRNDPNEWHMDDVSVSNGTTEMLLNGGFESGSLSPSWTASTPNGACNFYTYGAAIDTSSCRSGSYCLSDGCGGRTDQISQSFVVTAGEIYFISFWLKQGGGSGSGISVSVTLS